MNLKYKSWKWIEHDNTCMMSTCGHAHTYIHICIYAHIHPVKLNSFLQLVIYYTVYYWNLHLFWRYSLCFCKLIKKNKITKNKKKTTKTHLNVLVKIPIGRNEDFKPGYLQENVAVHMHKCVCLTESPQEEIYGRR